MSTLPFTLPTCDQPAAVRIPVYTPAPNGSESSLDAVAYVCAEHTEQALTAIRVAGLNAYPDPIAPDLSRTCGYVHVFATGTYGAFSPAGPEHPSWCDRRGCADRQQHRSGPLAVKPRPDDLTAAVTVELMQLLDFTAVLVALTFLGEDPDDITEHLITVDQAVALTYRIRTLADRAKGGRR